MKERALALRVVSVKADGQDQAESRAVGMDRPRRVCRCCGERMLEASADNPNMCADCGKLALDDLPTPPIALVPVEPDTAADTPGKGIRKNNVFLFWN